MYKIFATKAICMEFKIGNTRAYKKLQRGWMTIQSVHGTKMMKHLTSLYMYFSSKKIF